jgi:catechol 2,3-dioxygenase-like lactoylglutathione lyase family enzyme
VSQMVRNQITFRIEGTKLSKEEASVKRGENIQINFENMVLFVKDINRSREFYSNILNQEIADDFGRYVGFKGGFGIWKAEYALNTIFSRNLEPVELEYKNAEVYFECSAIEEIYHKIQELKIELIHPLKEQPWGQKVFRFFDPDRYIVEIAEPLSATVIRLFRDGLSPMKIAEKMHVPEQRIKEIIQAGL